MKILYDYQGFLQSRGGVSRYFVEIIKRLPQEIEPLISSLFSENIYLPEITGNIYRIPINFTKKQSVYRHLNRIFSNRELSRDKYDLFHATATETYFQEKLHKPLVITIHDLIEEKILKNPDEIARREWQIKHADHIITVSNNTRKDLLEHYSIAEEKVTTIYHGCPDLSGIPEIEIPYQRYILFVGSRNSAYKNFNRLVEAFALIHQQDSDLQLVCIGAPFNKAEYDLIHAVHMENHIFQISASDKMLFALYKKALVFVYPSLYEGFGIPILEAFTCHCPVCLSQASCFPEIAGDAAEYFDPLSVDDMVLAIRKVIYEPENREQLILKGDLKAQCYSWDKAANETANVYKHIVG